MLNITLFTKYQFDSRRKARELFTFLNEIGGVFVPVRFDSKEPVRRIYKPNDLDEPADLLSGYPELDAGGVLLKGGKYKYFALIRWNKLHVTDWYIDLGKQFFSKRERIDEFLGFLTGLCTRFPIIYGGAAPKEDWNAKHLLVKRQRGGGETHKMVGITLEACLPGVYWITLFGKRLVSYFGRKTIENLPAHSVFDLGKNGIAAVLREMPFSPEQPERLDHDRKILEILGSEHFFDIGAPKKACKVISGVTGGGNTDSAGAVKEKANASSEFEAFANQVVLTPEGEPYTDPQELAEVLVVYLHAEIKEVFDYSLDAFRALDAYFAEHPQRVEYSAKHLAMEFIPALGAYLGEVLARELGGRWRVEKNIARSKVIIKGRETQPFLAAYRCVHEDVKLVDIYNAVRSETSAR